MVVVIEAREYKYVCVCAITVSNLYTGKIVVVVVEVCDVEKRVAQTVVDRYTLTLHHSLIAHQLGGLTSRALGSYVAY